MAVNLPPQYFEAEAEYKKAQSAEAKLVALRKMWVILPKHKASEKVQSQLKSKISELNDEIEAIKSGPKKQSPLSYKIPRQGAGTVIFLGGANGGKSSLLRKLTKATPEVAPYPFTTREPIPGMMDWEDIRVQLIDLPPITEDVYEPFITHFARTADAAILVVDLGDDDGPFAVETVLQQLAQRKINLCRTPPDLEEDPTLFHLRTVLVCNKIDAEGATDRLEILQEMLADRLPMLNVSAERGDQLPELRTAMFQMLEVIRIYSKQPGKPAEMQSPFTIPRGGTVVDFAECIHTDLAENLKSAKVWGSAQYDGMSVKRDHVLADKDIVELQS